MTKKTFRHLARLGAFAAATAACAPAMAGVAAGMAKASTLLGEVSSGLTALGLIVVTIAILFVGFRMIFRNAQWADLAPVFWGGLLVGGASALAGALMGP